VPNFAFRAFKKNCQAIYDTGTPVVLVLVDGRPLVLDWMAEMIPAIIEAWLPGEEGVML